MRGTIKGVLTVAALALAAACSDTATVTAPDQPLFGKQTVTYPMTFNVVQDFSTAQPQSAVGGAGVIDFTGTVQTPTPCYDVTAVNSMARATVTVTMNAVDLGGICTQVITWNNYTGRITMPAGAYTVKMVHVMNGRSTTLWSGPVTVR